jgi:hypothetical protein
MSSFARTTHHLADQFKDSTSSALADFGAHAMKMLTSARTQENNAVEYALDRLGLQRRQSALRPAMYFAAGAVVAGGVALYFTPAFGKKLRTQILDLLGAVKEGEKELEKRIDSVLSDTKPATQVERPRVVPSTQNHS